MKVFRVEAIRTQKAPDEWPFFSVSFVVLASDCEWAEQIAEETIGLMEIQRGAYNSMRIDNITEISVSGM